MKGVRGGAKRGGGRRRQDPTFNALGVRLRAAPQHRPQALRLEAALADAPRSFGDLMVAVGSRDGREIVRVLDELRQAGRLDRVDDGIYVLADG